MTTTPDDQSLSITPTVAPAPVPSPAFDAGPDAGLVAGPDAGPDAGQPVWGTPAYQGPASQPSGYGSEPGQIVPPVPPIHTTSPSTTPQTGHRSTRGSGFFDGVRRTGVVRPDQGRVIAGVCAGLANRWGVSAVAVRVMFVVLSLLAGVGVLLYGLLWMLLPHTDGRIHAQELLGGRLTAGFVGALLAIIAGSGFDGFDDNGPGFFPLVLIALVVFFLVRRSRRSATR